VLIFINILVGIVLFCRYYPRFEYAEKAKDQDENGLSFP
jgi:hypothetical protein